MNKFRLDLSSFLPPKAKNREKKEEMSLMNAENYIQ